MAPYPDQYAGQYLDSYEGGSVGLFADSGLLVQAQPALADGGFDYEVTEGTEWVVGWEHVVDASGDPMDLTDVTATCDVLGDSVNGPALVSLTFTGGVGWFRLTAPATQTRGLAGTFRKRVCSWGLILHDPDGTPLPVWVPSNSRLTIHNVGVD